MLHLFVKTGEYSHHVTEQSEGHLGAIARTMTKLFEKLNDEYPDEPIEVTAIVENGEAVKYDVSAATQVLYRMNVLGNEGKL
jgi:hypothetical protein